MRAVIQRVVAANVSRMERISTSEGRSHTSKEVSRINQGIVVLLGVGRHDTENDVRYVAEKTANLRIFNDSNDEMNLSLQDVGGEILVVSQFTLYGDARKGRRPSYFEAAGPELAESLYELYCENLRSRGLTVKTGEFRTHMQVGLVNDGPVTILIDSKKEF